jgi:ubiquinone/menaquinone biosynthesis C-methylase UbiE
VKANDKSLPMAATEAARIQAVYGHYDADPRTLAKWDVRNPGNVCMWEEFTRATLGLLTHEGVHVNGARFLDVGCGWGTILGWLAEHGAKPAELYGVDLLENRITQARANHPAINFSIADARHLPFPGHFFDVILCVNFFGSILDHTLAAAIAIELRRVMTPAGMIIWCDLRYRNPWNPSVRGYTRRAIRGLFPGCQVALRSITLFPPIARRLGPFAPALYPMLARVPSLCVRHHGVIRLSATAASMTR